MQKFLHLLVFICFVLLTKNSTAQLLKQDFENWQSYNLYEEPKSFQTFNLFSFVSSSRANVTKIPGVKANAIHLENILSSNGFDVVPGYISYSDINQFPYGGIPFNQIADSVSFYTRFHFEPSDTGILAIVFKRVGIPVSFNVFPLTGDLPNFTKVTLPLGPSVIAPDSVLFIVASGNLGNPLAGSFVELDEINLIGSSKQLPNSSFEDWDKIGFEEPSGWATPNFSPAVYRSKIPVTKTTDAKSGLYALRLETVRTNSFGNVDTFGFTGPGDAGLGVISSFPFVSQNMKFSWSYKYEPVGNDTAWIALGFSKFNLNTKRSEFIDIEYLPLTTNSAYQSNFIKINLPQASDTLYFVVLSSNGFVVNAGSGVPHIGSVLYLDDVQIDDLTATDQISKSSFRLKSNPVQDYLEIISTSEKVQNYRIINLDGKILESSAFNNNTIDVSNLLPGKYVLQLNSENTTVKFIKQ